MWSELSRSRGDKEMYCTYILENHQKTLLRIGSIADLKQLLKERRIAL